MTVKSSLLLACRILFPKSAKRSAARQSLSGSLLCIGISLVPLIVVLAVSNGMIQGMTERIIGLSSSHIEAVLEKGIPAVSDAASLEDFASRLKTVEGVTNAYPEAGSAALAASSSFRIGVQVRAVLPEIFTENKSFASFFRVTDGDIGNFKTRFLPNLYAFKIRCAMSFPSTPIFIDGMNSIWTSMKISRRRKSCSSLSCCSSYSSHR